MNKIPWRSRPPGAQRSDNRRDGSESERRASAEAGKPSGSILKLSGTPQVNTKIAKITALFERKSPQLPHEVSQDNVTVKPTRRRGESVMHHISVFERGSSESALGPRVSTTSSTTRRRSTASSSSSSCSKIPSSSPILDSSVTHSQSTIGVIAGSLDKNAIDQEASSPSRSEHTGAAISNSTSSVFAPKSQSSPAMPTSSVIGTKDEHAGSSSATEKSGVARKRHKMASSSSSIRENSMSSSDGDDSSFPFRPRSSVVSRTSLVSVLSSSQSLTSVCARGKSSSTTSSKSAAGSGIFIRSAIGSELERLPQSQPLSPVDRPANLALCGGLRGCDSFPGTPLQTPFSERMSLCKSLSVMSKRDAASVQCIGYVNASVFLDEAIDEQLRDSQNPDFAASSFNPDSPWTGNSTSVQRDTMSSKSTPNLGGKRSKVGSRIQEQDRISCMSIDTDDESNMQLESIIGRQRLPDVPRAASRTNKVSADHAVLSSSPSSGSRIGDRAVGSLRKFGTRVKSIRLRSLDSDNSRQLDGSRVHPRSGNASSSDTDTSPVRRPACAMSSTTALAYATLSGEMKSHSLFELSQYTLPKPMAKSSESLHTMPTPSAEGKEGRGRWQGKHSDIGGGSDGDSSASVTGGTSRHHSFKVPQLKMGDKVLSPPILKLGLASSDGASMSDSITGEYSDSQQSLNSIQEPSNVDDKSTASNSCQASSLTSSSSLAAEEKQQPSVPKKSDSSKSKSKLKSQSVIELLDRPTLVPEKLLPVAGIVKAVSAGHLGVNSDKPHEGRSRNRSDPEQFCPSVRGILAASSMPAIRPTSVFAIERATSVANLTKTSLRKLFETSPAAECTHSSRPRVFSDPTSQPVLMNVFRSVCCTAGTATKATSTSEPRLRTRVSRSLRRPSDWGKCLTKRQKSIPYKYSMSVRRRTDGDVPAAINVTSPESRRQTAGAALQSVPNFADFARTECYQKRRASISELAMRKNQSLQQPPGRYLLLPDAVEEKSESAEIYADALWDYFGENELELGFKAGDVLEILDRNNDSWWWASSSGICGYIPSNHVRVRAIQEEEVTEVYDTASLDTSITQKKDIGDFLVPAAPNKKKRRKSSVEMRACVVEEIMQTESDYVGHLEDIVEGYMLRAEERKELFDEDVVVIIFSNVMELLNFQKQFLTELRAALCQDIAGDSMVGKVFANNQRRFSIYSEYCNNHPYAVEEMTKLQDTPQYKFFFEACRLIREMAAISLEGYLLTPVQKICKYPLQLSELLKYTPEDHPDYLPLKEAREGMKDVAILINNRKARVEKLEKLARWRLEVNDWSGSDVLTDSTMIVHDGVLTRVNKNSNQVRHYFLLDNQMVCCKKDAITRKLQYRHRFMLSDCSILQMDDNEQGLKFAWKIGHDEKSKTKWYIMQNRTEAERQEWMDAFQREREQAHLDQYDPDMSSYLEKARRAVKISLKLGLEGTCKENSWDRSRLVSSGKRGPGKAPPGSRTPRSIKSPNKESHRRSPSFLSRSNSKDWRIGSRVTT